MPTASHWYQQVHYGGVAVDGYELMAAGAQTRDAGLTQIEALPLSEVTTLVHEQAASRVSSHEPGAPDTLLPASLQQAVGLLV